MWWGLGTPGLQFAAKMGLKVVVWILRMDRWNYRGFWIWSHDRGCQERECGEGCAAVGCRRWNDGRLEMGLDAVIILPESQKAFDYGRLWTWPLKESW